jgi:hypothetical protein
MIMMDGTNEMTMYRKKGWSTFSEYAALNKYKYIFQQKLWYKRVD